MNKSCGWWLAVTFALAAGAYAQGGGKPVESHKDRGDTLKITVSGSMDMDYVYRDRAINEWSRWIHPTSRTVFGNTVGGNAQVKSDDFLFGYITLRFDMDLAEKVGAVLELENKKLSGVPTGVLATSNSATASGANGNVEWGNDSIAVSVEQAYVKVWDLFWQDLSMSAGAQDVTWDPRGRGNPIFFSPRRAESPWRELNRTRPLTDRDTAEPVGWVWNYTRGTSNSTMFWLPSISEGGFLSSDEGALGMWSYFNMDSMGKGSRVGALVTGFYGGQNVFSTGSPPGVTAFTDDHGQLIWTVGEAAVVKMGSGLELFEEAYLQTGHAGHINTQSPSTRGLVDQHSAALDFGFRWESSQSPLWFEWDYLYVRGDQDQDDASQTAFVSYENNNKLTILESNELGLDIDNNYWAMHFSLGTAFTTAGAIEKNVTSEVVLGYAKMNYDLPTRNFAITSSSFDREDQLGVEIDLKSAWWLNKSAGFDTSFNVLFASDVMETFTNSEDSTTWLWTLGTTVRF